LIIGLSSAGKTLLLYNSIFNDDWKDQYRKGPEDIPEEDN
jgi:hypothetical protein